MIIGNSGYKELYQSDTKEFVSTHVQFTVNPGVTHSRLLDDDGICYYAIIINWLMILFRYLIR